LRGSEAGDVERKWRDGQGGEGSERRAGRTNTNCSQLWHYVSQRPRWPRWIFVL